MVLVFASFHVAVRRLIQHVHTQYSEGAVQTHIVIIAVITEDCEMNLTFIEGMARFHRLLVIENI